MPLLVTATGPRSMGVLRVVFGLLEFAEVKMT